MDKRHDEMLHKFNMDYTNIGWYMVSYKQNLWEQLELVMYNEVPFGLFRNIFIQVFSWFMIMRLG